MFGGYFHKGLEILIFKIKYFEEYLGALQAETALLVEFDERPEELSHLLQILRKKEQSEGRQLHVVPTQDVGDVGTIYAVFWVKDPNYRTD